MGDRLCRRGLCPCSKESTSFRSDSVGQISIERTLIIATCIGFFVALILAWYHGERGAQRVTGTELLHSLALVLAVGGGFLWRFAAACGACAR